ncbi:MAG: hypothetical protein AB1730_10500 [Myxococcota bacterium]
MMRVLRATFVLCVAALAASACQDRTRTRRVLEPFTIVPGTPTVDAKAPEVQVDGTQETSDFGVNVPRQCDVYRQLPVRQVDILWVVDSSGSMAPKQARLAANFQGFINQLVSADPPIDFHIAVTSTDTDAAANRGKLRPWTISGFTEDFIACAPTAQGGVSCNTGPDVMSAVAAFGQMSQVGITGSAQERGLYAAYLALTNPLNHSTPAVTRFVRPEAALYVVVVSDEDDASCNPLTRQATCTADPGCRCAPDNALVGAGAWGSTEYFVRFLETFKGYGNEESVALAAIVADSDDAGVPSQFGDPSPHVGCCRSLTGQPCPTGGANDGGYEIAYYGGRYVQVAAATGGVTVSICQDDFSQALAALGYAASGLRQDFRLSRGPDLKVDGGVAEGIAAYVSGPTAANCMVDGNCPMGEFCRGQRCAQRLPVSMTPVATGAEYVRCDTAGLRNMVRFGGSAIPEPLSTVELCYDVLATFNNSCP